jgi:cytochrome b subunit of formate dehydrogenase
LKKIGSKKFILIALIIFVLLAIAGFILDRMTMEEAPAPPQTRLVDIDSAFLDVSVITV